MTKVIITAIGILLTLLVAGGFTLWPKGQPSAPQVKTPSTPIATSSPQKKTTPPIEREVPKGMGGLAGNVTIGPLSPADISGVSRAPAPLPGARILIFGSNGQQIKSAVTDDDGRYSVRLPPGTYRIEMAPLADGRFTKDLPATVTITEGQDTSLEIRVDTGIR